MLLRHNSALRILLFRYAVVRPTETSSGLEGAVRDRRQARCHALRCALARAGHHVGERKAGFLIVGRQTLVPFKAEIIIDRGLPVLRTVPRPPVRPGQGGNQFVARIVGQRGPDVASARAISRRTVSDGQRP